MTKARLVMILLLIASFIYSQRPGDSFINKCEYFNFLNDSIIDFITIGSYSGALVDFKSGKGIYKILENKLSIQLKDSFHYSEQFKHEKTEIDCGKIEEMNNGTIDYIIVNLSNDSIRLIGPIISDYKKLNRKRFCETFYNWPWRWSFRKQHWFDPRERILIKEKITGANNRSYAIAGPRGC